MKTKPNVPLLEQLGPGLLTGASDDDPSGIGTYSQAGAQFGFGFLWVMLFSYPLMVSIQEISARIGRTTGQGIAANIRAYYSRPILYVAVVLLLIANTLNLAADLGAMGEALKLLIGGPTLLYTCLFGILSLVLQVLVPYSLYVRYLKWLTFALFSYVITAFTVNISWNEALIATFIPKIDLHGEHMMTLVAIFGTTISPYLFFWQASQECEEIGAHLASRPLRKAPQQAKSELRRIRIDTLVGMGVSNLVAFFIILTSAAALHSHGIKNIETAAQAAAALKPLAGNFAFFLFALGIVGTGLLAVPVLAGSSAYALGEAFRWRIGLELKPFEARAFYSVMAVSTFVGLLLNLLRINPIKALVWSAAINGVVAVPIMFLLMHMASNSRVMGGQTIPLGLKIGGWAATVVMFLVSVVMIVSYCIGGLH